MQIPPPIPAAELEAMDWRERSRLHKTDHQLDVETFMEKAQHAGPSFPQLPDEETRVRRARLVLEESLELIEALGVEVLVHGHDGGSTLLLPSGVTDGTLAIRADRNAELNLAEIVKEVADVHVVTTGTASSCGVGMRRIQQCVDHNNLCKFGPGSYLDSNGKWRKPHDYKKADVMPYLVEQGYIPKDSSE